MRSIPRSAAASVLSCLLAASLSAGAQVAPAPSLVVPLRHTTQGPFWPPAELVDEDGNYVLLGFLLTDVGGGVVVPIPNQAALISKDTVPPVDSQGRRAIDDWFAAPYDVIRPLDLSPGSPDLDIVLYANSFGPPRADDSGAPRMPREGDGPYNLNGVRPVCPEVFPTTSQDFAFTRPRMPLHRVPVNGFQGDQVAYDPDSGETFDPAIATGPGCGNNCPGEDPGIDERRDEPITLGDVLRGEGKLEITLTDFDPDRGAYTAALFDIKLKKMLPDSLYTVWTVRSRRIPGHPAFDSRRQPDPLAVPNVIVTDAEGKGRHTFKVTHPFPAPETDPTGRRILGVLVVFHSDHQSWGSCVSRFGTGVDVHVTFNTFDGANLDMTSFVTVAP